MGKKKEAEFSRVAFFDDDVNNLAIGVDALETILPDVEVSTAQTEEEFRDILSKSTFDVAITDIMVEGKALGLDILKWVKKTFPQMGTLALSAHPKYIMPAIECGVLGFVLKSQVERLPEAVQEVSKGQLYLTPEVQKILCDEIFLRREHEKNWKLWKHLTDRERTILFLRNKGYTHRELAATLSISPHTVRNQTTSLLRKVGKKNLNEATNLFSPMIEQY